MIKLFFTFLLTLLINEAFSQVATLNNRFCDAAELICYDNSGVSKSFNTTIEGFCVTSSVSLFYEIKSSNIPSTSIGNFTTNIATTYKLYGPYESLSDGCASYNESSSTPVNTSASSSTSHVISYTTTPSKTYVLEVIFPACSGTISFNISREYGCKDNISCSDCLKSFMPTPGKYIVSAWVKKEGAGSLDTNYNAARLKVSCPSVSGSTVYFYATGQVIDGWKRIEGVYTIPGTATNFELKLEVTSGTYLFDDVRMFPYDGSMISYVYDPINLRLLAELDERNYAKIYEYDEEGKLIRVKKETEKGVMTIQENRENSKKITP